MNTIIFYSEKGQYYDCNTILQVLKKNSEQSFNIIFTDTLKNIDTKDIIIILCSHIRHSAVKHIDKSAHIIVDANNYHSIRLLAQSRLRVYTCGFCSKDFVTFSSRLENEAVVSLQRNVRLLNKCRYEPFEIPCSLTAKYSDYTILSCVLTLILLNIINEKTNYPLKI